MTCGCKKHDQWSKDKPFTLLKISWRKARKSTIDGLIKHELLSTKSQYVCTVCLHHFETHFEHRQTAEEIANSIRLGKFSPHELKLIAEALGEHISEDVCADSSNVSQQYKDPTYLQQYDASLWLQHVNPILLSFITSMCKSNKSHAIAIAIEQIYYCINCNIIMPLSFVQNLMIYYITGSKTACSISSKHRPSPSYSTLINWIESQSNEPLQVSGHGDLVTFFDNSQVLARNWRVRYDAKAMVSVITTLLHMFPQQDHSLQTQEELTPSRWLRFDVQHFTLSLPSFLNCDLSLFRHYRAQVLSHLIESVMNEQKCSASGISDDYDQRQLPEVEAVGTEASYRAVFDETSTKIRIIRSDSIAHRYSLVDAGSLINPDLVVGEPILVNPCSYAAMKVVLHRILQDSGVGVSRSWTVVGCDGLPYNLAARVMAITYKCPLCDQTDISGSDNWHEHLLNEHNQTLPDPDNHLTFGTVLLVPGPGHMEINMTKAAFKLLWHVVLQDLGRLLGFKSPKAQASCQNASDHHKAWQMIEILFWGTGAELVVPFVRHCQRSGIHPDVAGFGEWLSDRTDKRYVFLADVLFTYIMALFLFRCGIRRGNHSLAMQSFNRYSDLFFGLNMSQYQELSVRYHHTVASSPQPVRDFLQSTLSFSASGSSDRGEGGDFILEAKNRRIQMWMPPGLPTPHHWQRICRNLDTLDSIREHLTDVPTAGSHLVDLRKEIRHWRHHLRQSEYLGSPMSTRPHVSLGGKPLDLHLASFAHTCQDNKQKFVEETVSGKPLGSHHKLPRLYVLAGEREEANDITKKTNSELCGLIDDTIGRLCDAGSADLGDSRREYLKDVRTGTKAVLLTFLRRVTDTLTEVLEAAESRECDAPDD